MQTTCSRRTLFNPLKKVSLTLVSGPPMVHCKRHMCFYKTVQYHEGMQVRFQKKLNFLTGSQLITDDGFQYQTTQWFLMKTSIENLFVNDTYLNRL